MLFRKAEVETGQTLLLYGTNGGVETVLCQLGRHLGLRVIGTAFPRHRDALHSMGVELIDYNALDLTEPIRAVAPDGVDAAFNHLGRESARMSYGLLKSGGGVHHLEAEWDHL